MGRSSLRQRLFAARNFFKYGILVLVLLLCVCFATSNVTKAAPQVQSTTQKHCVAVNNNPWCYNFTAPGNRIYHPPTAFCKYFACVSSFWTATRGYVAKCVSGKYTHSGGIRGACSRNGGISRPLYSH